MRREAEQWSDSALINIEEGKLMGKVTLQTETLAEKLNRTIHMSAVLIDQFNKNHMHKHKKKHGT